MDRYVSSSELRPTVLRLDFGVPFSFFCCCCLGSRNRITDTFSKHCRSSSGFPFPFPSLIGLSLLFIQTSSKNHRASFSTCAFNCFWLSNSRLVLIDILRVPMRDKYGGLSALLYLLPYSRIAIWLFMLTPELNQVRAGVIIPLLSKFSPFKVFVVLAWVNYQVITMVIGEKLQIYFKFY